MAVAALLACLSVVAAAPAPREQSGLQSCYKPAPERRTTKVLSPLPSDSIMPADVPTDFTWMNVNGTNFLTRMVTQLQPRPCGSCWVMAATSALSDRIRIMTQARLPSITVSPQFLLDHPKSAPEAGSCDGGDSALAFAFMERYGIPDETCLPFQGVHYSAWGEGDLETQMCRTCDRFGNCMWVNGTVYGVSQHGDIAPGPSSERAR